MPLGHVPVMNIHRIPLLLAVVFLAAFRPMAWAGEHKNIGPAIYDEHADAAAQIAAALATAKAGNKRVFLQFGANWCIWCHRLHDLLDTDPLLNAEWKADYVSVLVDTNEGHNQATNAKYGSPANMGIPALVVLDADGNTLIVKDSSELEEDDHHNPQKVMAFLKAYAPKR